MLTVTLLLVLAAFVIACANAIGKSQLWPSVILLCVVELLRILPR